jgi:enamine deaminase RidA (YjgF/YER057c/UK114 family)
MPNERWCRLRDPVRGPILSSDEHEFPPPFPPAGNYLSCVIDGGLVYVGGHGPVAGDQMIRGKVGGDLTLEQGREAARMTALSILATLQAELGDLDRIQRIIKVFGMVNVAPGFDQTPAVLDGARTCWSRSSARPGAIPAQRSVWPSCPSASPPKSSS